MDQEIYDDKRDFLKTCQLIEDKALKSRAFHDDSHYDVMYFNFAKGEDDASLSEALIGFKKQTLWMVFPYAYLARKAVLMALGSEALIPFHEAIAKLAYVSPYSDLSTYCFDNSDSTVRQFIKQKILVNALEDVPMELLPAYFKSLKASKLGYRNLITMIEAFIGSNRATLEKGLQRHDQPSIKAYGLLPIDSDIETAQRYLSLERVGKECIKYNQERQKNIRTAVRIGLKNLAIRAGYSCQKKMEDALAEFIESEREKFVASIPVDPWKVLFELRTISEWDVRLALSGSKPRLSISVKNKQLKTIPDSFSKMPESQPYTEAVTLLEQAVSSLKKIKPSVKYSNYYDFYNGEEIKGQVVNQQIMAKALQNLPDKILMPYLNALRTNNSDYAEFIMMIEAFKGSNRAKLEKAIVRHGQAALKAYGLLPTKSKKEIAQRYVTLKKAWKECSKYGAERQANTRAAVQVGLENLATRAGYHDSIRMEWDLEADINTDAQAFFEVRTIDQWDVNIGLDGIKPVLQVSKKGKALKGIPVGLRKSKEYPQYRAVMDTLKEQARRFRRSLENMMTSKEEIALKELKKLTKIPAMHCFLVNLLGINENNEIGLIDPNKLVLIDADKQYKIKQTIRIVHTHDLFKQAVLSHWQQQIVEQQIVQPFKQVFRELYILTPAEQESATFTNRFSERSVDGSIAYRLLQSRGWNQGEMIATKSWASHKLEAHWEFPDIQHYMAAHEELSSSKLYFIANGKWGLSNAIPLQKICPILFSETLRDADLVVSVAQPRDNNKTGFWSNEMQQHRISVAKHIAKNLGINDLRFEDKHVYVQGKWNEYTIHLGTANTYLGKKHLCIGSDIRDRKKKIYLPFADADTTISEIIAKILLLRHDDKITDSTILGQIRPHKASMLED